MFYAQSTAKGQIRVKQNVFQPQVTILIHYLIHIPPLRIALEKFGENQVEWAGKQETRSVGTL